MRAVSAFLSSGSREDITREVSADAFSLVVKKEKLCLLD
jgi:hypothetical protein